MNDENIMNTTTEEVFEGISNSGLDWKTVAIVGAGAFALGMVADAVVKPKVAGLIAHDEDDEEEKPKRRKRSKGETVIDVEAEEVDDEE